MMAFGSLTYLAEVLDILNGSRELKRSVVGVGKQCGWTMAGTAVGGICGGPVGAACGGLLGVFFGYQTSDDYQSVIAVVNEMSDDEKYELQKRIQTLVGSSLIEDFVTYVQNEVNRQLLMGTMQESANRYQQRSKAM